MSEYKLGKGESYFFREHDTRWRRVAKNAIPKHDWEKVKNLPLGGIYNNSPDALHPETTKTGRNCVFCGLPGMRSKYINAQMVYLCVQDYEDKTTGETAHRVKELQNAKLDQVND